MRKTTVGLGPTTVTGSAPVEQARLRVGGVDGVGIGIRASAVVRISIARLRRSIDRSSPPVDAGPRRVVTEPRRIATAASAVWP